MRRAPAEERGAIEPTREMIELRAYEHFVRRGGENGHDLDDWLAAEDGLRRELAIALRVTRAVEQQQALPD